MYFSVIQFCPSVIRAVLSVIIRVETVRLVMLYSTFWKSYTEITGGPVLIRGPSFVLLKVDRPGAYWAVGVSLTTHGDMLTVTMRTKPINIVIEYS